MHKGYDYARVANPTRTALEECLASLGERRARARVLVRPRRDDVDHAPARPRRPRRLRERRLRRYVPDVLAGLRAEGLPLHLRDPRRALGRPGGAPRRRAARLDRDADEPAAQPRRHRRRRGRDTRRRRRCSSSTTPSRRRTSRHPLDLGADIVVHSTTKYLGGHSDVIGGFAGTNDPTIAERLRFLQKSLGAVPGPFDAWLVLRGVKTLAVRMDRQCANARARRRVPRLPPARHEVLWPGLPDHPGHEVAARQMRDFGGMVSFLVETRRGGGRARRADLGVDARREPRRCREPDRASGPHDPRLDCGGPVRVAGEPDPALGRPRVGRRSRGRPRPRVGAGSGASVDLASSTSARPTRIGVRHSFCQRPRVPIPCRFVHKRGNLGRIPARHLLLSASSANMGMPAPDDLPPPGV